MDSSDIYYSDNSQLIDENNAEWMGNTVLIENHDITWQEDGPEITVDYSETANKTLTETDEYLTATDNDETTNDQSQYFSIIESNCDDVDTYNSTTENRKFFVKVAVNKEEVIIPDIAKLDTEDELTEPECSARNETTDDQVILYRMEGSDELYAVQIADDGNGNFQKYKYRVRQNDDGQLEAIPGSIEIQSADQNDIEEQENDSDLEDLQPKDQKPNTETLALINQHIRGVESSEIENNFYLSNVHPLNNINPDDYLIQNTYEQDTEEEYQTVEGVHVTGDSESNSQSENIEATEYIKSENIYPPTENSESEYEIEELDEAFQDENINDTYDEHSNNDNPQILQHKTNIDNFNVNSDSEKDNRNVTIFKDDKHLSYLVVKAKEKENVSIIRPTTNFNSSNLRSILKSNFSTNKLKNSTPKTDEKENSLNIPTICVSNKVLEPKSVKNDVTTNNILLKSARQPRKQTIKPVERAGSEIIVQPLVYTVTEDNVITSTTVKKKRVIQEVLQVSDESDPEFTLKPKKKRIRKTKYNKRGRPRNVEITIIDSDDEEIDQESDGSVIEVLTDEEEETSDQKQNESDNNNEESNKNPVLDENEEKVQEEIESNNSKNKNESVEENVKPKNDTDDKPAGKSIGNKKNKCSYCPKTFPRLITLKKHMIIHSNRRSLRLRTSNVENKEPDEKSANLNFENSKVNDSKPRSFNCLKCKLKFLTDAQFKRHQTIHLPKNSTVKKQISPIRKPKKQILISQKHLRSQNKQPETNLRSQRLLPIRKSIVNDNKTKEIFKCEYCSQIFGTRTLLIVHRNSHKTFPCPNCKTTFTAKLLLDDHLRKNCVKISTKKIKPKSPVKKFSSKRINSKCEICQQVFPTLKSLQIHKNITHKRLNKVSDDTKRIIKPKGAHGGVPLSLKMQQALNKLKTKS